MLSEPVNKSAVSIDIKWEQVFVVTYIVSFMRKMNCDAVQVVFRHELIFGKRDPARIKIFFFNLSAKLNANPPSILAVTANMFKFGGFEKNWF